MKHLILFLFFFISNDCFSQQGVFKSDVIVDGDLSEWGEKLDQYDKENMLWYSVANDNDFLYLAIHKDKHAIKATNGKVQIYVSGNKISDKTFSIIYPTAMRTLYPGQGYRTSNSWDFLLVNRLGDVNGDTLSVFNDLGIQAGGKLIDTEEGKKKKVPSAGDNQMRTFSIDISLDNKPAIITPRSKGKIADFEFAIPLKHLKIESGKLNVKISLKGSSNGSAEYISSISNAMEGEGKDEELDSLTATEYTFTYTLVKK